MVTVIKVKGEVKVTGCDECPFMNGFPELDYGESMGYDNLYCGLLGGEGFIGESYKPHDEALPNCPIISIETKAEES